MKQYCLTFQPLGTLSHIPDAQTIFGAICNILIQTQGDEAFQKYIRSFNNQPLMIHSSMFPHGYLPMVHQSLFSIDYINQKLLEEDSSNQLNYLQTMKQLKKIKYVTQKVYFHYILKNHFDELKQDLLDHKLIVIEGCLQFKDEDKNYVMDTVVNTHVQKNLFYFDQKDDNELYYNKDIYCREGTTFDIYVKTEMSKEDIKRIFMYSHYFGFGPKHSSGKNSFKFISVKEIKIDQRVQKVLLSKSDLDENFKLSDSRYQIISKKHQTGQYYLNNQITGRFNLFTEGSLMKVVDDKDYYGHLIKLNNDDHPIYYYAIGYVM